MAIRIDGKALAAKVKEQVRAEAAKLRRQAGLAVILVGENPASKVYVAGRTAPNAASAASPTSSRRRLPRRNCWT